MDTPTVTIVIVCMNNTNNLTTCLDSMEKYVKIHMEVLVVAYLFSQENLTKAKHRYGWVKFIESNHIRGFSENNNLALKEANGEYCFILNDDTYLEDDVVTNLLNTFSKLANNVAIVSPKILNVDNTTQYCGRRRLDIRHFLYSSVGLLRLIEKYSTHEHENRKDIFKTHNISGAAFMIKTEVFKKVGWFDEYYFFSPEDIALSTKLNEIGYQCFVNAKTSIVHYGGMTGKSLSCVQTATKPAQIKGLVSFFAGGKKYSIIFLSIFIFNVTIIKFFYHRLKSLFISYHSRENYILSIADLNILKSVLTNHTPKEIFLKFYNGIKNEKL